MTPRHPEPHKPAIPISLGAAGANPWMIGLWAATAAAAIAGITLTASNSDTSAFDYSPTGAVVGHTLLGIAGVLLAGLLVAGAICWQLRRR